MGLFARHVEAAGIPTVSVSSCLDITQAVRPPRVAFLNFPLGHAVGKAFDPALQRSIILDALNLLKTVKESGTLVSLSYKWDERDSEDSWERSAEVH